MKKVFFVFFAVMILFCAACSSSSKDDTSDTCTENPSAPECQTDNEEEGSSPEESEGEEG